MPKATGRGPSRIVQVGALTALCGALLVGCGDDGDDGDSREVGDTTTPSATAEADDFEGDAFVLDDVTGRDLIEGTTVRVSFQDGLTVNAGCNTMFGAYTVASEGGATVVRWDAEPASTRIGCDPAQTEQDEWIAGLFTTGVTVEPETEDGDDDGEGEEDSPDLVLVAGDVRMELSEVDDADEPGEHDFGARINGPTTATPPEILQMTLTNTGRRRDTYQVTVTPATSGVAEPLNLTLGSGATGKFQLQVTATPLIIKVESVGAGGFVDAYTLR